MSVSKFVTVNGLRLHYLDFGEPSKPALICIHGLSGNAHNFDGVAAHLAANYRVISVDVRGRGDSGWGPAAGYTPLVYLSDLARMLDQLALRRVTLIGTSMGGIISMLYAANHLQRVDRLVLNDVGPEVDSSGLGRIAGYMSTRPAGFSNLAEVAAYFRDNYPALREAPEADLIQYVKWSVKPTAGGRLTWKMDPTIGESMRGGPSARPMPLWSTYALIAAPILIVRGAESDILSRATAARMCKVNPKATLVEVPGVAHAPSLLEEQALGAILKFLAR